MTSAERYYKEMCHTKTQAIYYSKYYKFLVHLDRFIQFTILGSSAFGLSHYAFELTKNNSFWITTTIFISNIIVFGLSFFIDLKTMVVKLNYLTSRLQFLASEMELKWYDISNGKLADEEIHRLWMNFKKQKEKYDQLYNPQDLINFECFMKQAKKESYNYIIQTYLKGEQTNESAEQTRQ